MPFFLLNIHQWLLKNKILNIFIIKQLKYAEKWTTDHHCQVMDCRSSLLAHSLVNHLSSPPFCSPVAFNPFLHSRMLLSIVFWCSSPFVTFLNERSADCRFKSVSKLSFSYKNNIQNQYNKENYKPETQVSKWSQHFR